MILILLNSLKKHKQTNPKIKYPQIVLIRYMENFSLTATILHTFYGQRM